VNNTRGLSRLSPRRPRVPRQQPRRAHDDRPPPDAVARDCPVHREHALSWWWACPPTLRTRKLSAIIAGLGLVIAGILATKTPIAATHTPRASSCSRPWSRTPKMLIAIVGLLLLMLLAGTRGPRRRKNPPIASGRRVFDPPPQQPGRVSTPFFLFSLNWPHALRPTRDDLIWLFPGPRAHQPSHVHHGDHLDGAQTAAARQGVKLLLPGGSGRGPYSSMGFAPCSTAPNWHEPTSTASPASFATHGNQQHRHRGDAAGPYWPGLQDRPACRCTSTRADVYEGCSAAGPPAFLAFVPKTAGFLGILLLTATMGWSFKPGHHDGLVHSVTDGHQLPEVIRLALVGHRRPHQ